MDDWNSEEMLWCLTCINKTIQTDVKVIVKDHSLGKLALPRIVYEAKLGDIYLLITRNPGVPLNSLLGNFEFDYRKEHISIVPEFSWINSDERIQKIKKHRLQLFLNWAKIRQSAQETTSSPSRRTTNGDV